MSMETEVQHEPGLQLSDLVNAFSDKKSSKLKGLVHDGTHLCSWEMQSAIVVKAIKTTKKKQALQA